MYSDVDPPISKGSKPLSTQAGGVRITFMAEMISLIINKVKTKEKIAATSENFEGTYKM